MTLSLQIILTIFLFLFLPIFGIYLLFRKKPYNSKQEPYWIEKLNLTPEAKSVHLKQYYKQTEKFFSIKWFLEYWKGQRTAFHAWFVFYFSIGLIISTLLLFIGEFRIQMLAENKIMLQGFFGIAYIAYYILASIILWRCAANSTLFYKWFARMFIFLPLVQVIR